MDVEPSNRVIVGVDGSKPEGMTLTVREGGPAHALIDISGGARTLVVGSRGHGGFAGLLLGSWTWWWTPPCG